MPDRRIRITVDTATTITAVRTDARTPRWTFVYAPGASAGIDDPFGAHAARVLPEDGISVVRIQFPYAEAGRRSPDRPAVLEATWRATIDAIAGDGVPLVVGGRSMGGRIASQVVAAGAEVDGVALFAYPLHPPGKPEQMRDGHLRDLGVPALFCSGTNDAFASPDELRALVKKLRGAKLHLLDGADHGFTVRKSSGRTREDVWQDALSAFVAWLATLRRV
jgi:predicted alpha/beta-hydrolase family hydrolase